MKRKYKSAVLNEENILVDYEQVEIDLSKDHHKQLQYYLISQGYYLRSIKSKGDVLIVPEECNLAKSQYKWTGVTFQKLGTGFGKPKKLPNGVTQEHATYLFYKAVIEGNPIPSDCKEVLVDYYEENLKKRNEEKLKSGGLNQ